MSNENLLDEVMDNGNSGDITHNMKSSMQGTAPWMKFLGILFMITGGLYTIVSLIALFASPLTGILSLALSGVYIYMGYLIFKSGADYSSFLMSNNTKSLESSLENQKKWWMIMGILTIVMIVLMIGFFIFGASIMNQVRGNDPEQMQRLIEQMNEMN